MRDFSTSPLEITASFWRNRHLVGTLTKREILSRYRGSVLGVAWSFFNPVLMLAVYTFVFSVVFKARWGGGDESRLGFALALFAGLLVFNFFSECITRAPKLIVANVNYVKKVVFPLEVLSFVAMGAAGFQMVVNLGVWLVFYLLCFGVPPLSILLFPLVILPLALMTLGVTWFLASLGVFLRDVAEVATILTSMLLFLSPIFYPVSALPPGYQTLLHVNPLTSILEQVRGVMIHGQAPDPVYWSAGLAVSLLIAWSGFAWFQKTRKGFADVL